MSKYLLFLKTIYNNTMDKKDIIRPVFEKNEKYKVKFEDDYVYMLDVEYGFYKDYILGYDKKLENIDYVVIEE